MYSNLVVDLDLSSIFQSSNGSGHLVVDLDLSSITIYYQ